MYNREDLQNRVEMAISDIHKLNIAKQIWEKLVPEITATSNDAFTTSVTSDKSGTAKTV